MVELIYNKIKIGAIFCQVINRRHFTQFIPSITITNHAWNGADPNFIIIGAIINIFICLSIIILENQEEYKLFIKQHIKKKHEAIVCTKKYFNADSLDKIFLVFIISGMKEIIFISSPIHIPNQLDEEMVIIDLITIIKENIRFKLLIINKLFITLWCESIKDFDSLGIFRLFNVIKIHMYIIYPIKVTLLSGTSFNFIVYKEY